MASLKDLRNRIASVKATQKITKAMQMVAAAKLRRAQAAAEAARPYAERMDDGARQYRRRGVGGRSAPRAAGRHRRGQTCICSSSAPAERGLCGAFNSSIARLARDQRERAHCRGQDGQDPLRRQEGLRPAAPPVRQAHHRADRTARRAPDRLRRRRCDRQEDHRAVRGRRVRRRDAVLLALPVGDRADPDRAADHSGGDRRGRRAPAGARRATNTSRRRTRSSRPCCRATSRCRSSARCSKTPPPNRARA